MKKIFGATMSASVLAAMASSAADASDAMQKPVSSLTPATPVNVKSNPWMVSVEGGAAFSNFSRDSFDSEGKLGLTPETDVGGYGAISIGRKIEGTEFDWRIGASATQFLTNEASAFAGPYALSIESDAGFQSVDFDIGSKIGGGMLDGRIFLGVRGLYEQDSASTAVDKLGYLSGSIDGKHEFLGAGPRIGADVRFGGTFGIVGSVSAAILYGVHNSQVSFDANYLGSAYSVPIASETDTDWVTDVSASAGASWRPSDATEFVVGYRAERLGSIKAMQTDDVMEHGPFLKLNVKF